MVSTIWKAVEGSRAISKIGPLLLLGLTLSTAPGFAEQPAQPPPQKAAAEAETKAYRQLDADLFGIPRELEPAVDFWLTVYTKYDNHVVLLHDDLYLNVIYAALDFSELDDSTVSEVRRQRARLERLREAREKYRSILSDSAKGEASKAYPNDQARIEKQFEQIPGSRARFAEAQGRMRTQTCLRNRFAEAIGRSGFYLEEMEAVFAQHGLPTELTRLPFVESLFQWNARSSAAAGGVWQFMPSTARLYLRMSAEYDERFDPLRATSAAAKFLGENHQALGTWPLAITAYNHGRAGMMRAVRRLETTDLGQIVERYNSRTFGFASRNFYAEFVAAYLAYENRDFYFPGVEPSPRIAFDEFEPPDFVHLPDLARTASIDDEQLRELNPAISREVWNGHLFLPKTYNLRVPQGQLAAVSAAYQQLPVDRRSPHQVGLRYRVHQGDTLGAIARRFGTSISALKGANGLRGHMIRAGQTLLIPGNQSPVTITSQPIQVAKGGVHRVARGESLALIARRYGTDIKTLQTANSLDSPDRLHVGQRLTIPGGDRATHIVQPGETLAAIARRYNTSVAALQKANQLASDLIKPDQVLVIP